MGQRVAVLGGGIAGLTTALELTATPELRERYEVTVHQVGWRCGGKCSTGRNHDAGDRIQEHGLHLWFGGYDNAFRLLGDCYRELDRPEGTPLARIEHAWSPLSHVALYDQYRDRWSPSYRSFDIEPGAPWDPVPVPRFWDMTVSVFHAVEAHLLGLRDRSGVDRHGPAGTLDAWLRRAGDATEATLVHAAGRYLDWHHRRDTQRKRHVHPFAAVLERLRDHIWRRHVRDHLDDDDVRHAFSQIDTMLTTLVGIIRDDLLWRGFAVVNDEDFADWLGRHGAQPTTLQGPDVRVIYDQCFAGNRGPNTTGSEPGREQERGMAAGAAIYSLVRTRLPYRGSIMWQARGGMGDTAIVPMYETLVKRGVRFEFFDSVVDLGVDTGSMVVNRVDLVRQLDVGDGYDPLVDVKGLRCWPDRPRWDQLPDGDRVASLGIDFERGEAVPGAPVRSLRLGVDFDSVVLAISAAGLPAISREVMAASPRYREMLEHTNTIMTQAFQLWLTEDADQVGFPSERGATSSFIEPVDTGCDNCQALPSENWPAGREPKGLWYFCGDLLDVAGEPVGGATRRAHDGGLEYLRHIGDQWPDAVGADGQFRWELLAAPDGVDGEARFDHQYWRANDVPTERYVQTMPGTVDYRLAADESGLSNLVLAGDWTRNGFDIGAVEATVMSGMQASRAISGSPAEIAWDHHVWMVDG